MIRLRAQSAQRPIVFLVVALLFLGGCLRETDSDAPISSGGGGVIESGQVVDSKGFRMDGCILTEGQAIAADNFAGGGKLPGSAQCRPGNLFTHKTTSHEPEFSTDVCALTDRTKLRTSGALLNCYIEADEKELQFHGVSMAFNVPTDYCEYFSFTPYYFWNYQPGDEAHTNGATSVKMILSLEGKIKSVDGHSNAAFKDGFEATTDLAFNSPNDDAIPNADGTGAQCAYDYSSNEPPGPNCCRGTYIQYLCRASDENSDGEDDAPSGSYSAAPFDFCPSNYNEETVVGKWGGDPRNCLSGPSVLTGENKRPMQFVYEVTGTGINGIYRTYGNGDLRVGSNFFHANHFAHHRLVSSVSFSASTDTVSLVQHGFSNGELVAFNSIQSTTGISLYTGYYVVNADTDSFQVSSTAGGAALNLTTDGTGEVSSIISPVAVTFADAGDLVNLAGHGLQDGQRIVFDTITTTTGMSTNTIYYVVKAGSGSFQVASTAGGSPLALTMDGSGSFFIPLSQAIAQVTFTDTGDTVGLTDHGLKNGQPILFLSVSSTTGLTLRAGYYVKNASRNSFQLSATVGGAAVPLATNGSGIMAVLPDKSLSLDPDGPETWRPDSLKMWAGIRPFPVYDLSCWDRGWELLARIRVFTREWNTKGALENFKANAAGSSLLSRPDDSGPEDGTNLPDKNDADDLRDLQFSGALFPSYPALINGISDVDARALSSFKFAGDGDHHSQCTLDEHQWPTP